MHHHYYPKEHDHPCYFNPPPQTTVPRFKGAYPICLHWSHNGEPFSANRTPPPSHFSRRPAQTMIMQKNCEQNEDLSTRPRHNRSPSNESVSRLHQQSGGFAGQQRRSSFSKDNNGYYNQHSGFRRQNYNQRGRHHNGHPRGGYSNHINNGQVSDYSQSSGNYNGYQQKLTQNRSYQNYSLHQSKHYQSLYTQHKPIFNSTQGDYGSYSVRRPSPSSSPPPNGSSSNATPSFPANRRGEQPQNGEMEPEKIHNYRAAGTAPGGFSTGSSPFKVPPPQPPSTPSEKTKEEWHRPFLLAPPPGLHMRHGVPDAKMELQLKAMPSMEMHAPMSLPTTPSEISERGMQFRASMKDGPIARSVDSVDAKHPCFADERMRRALDGLAPQVKSHHQIPVPLGNDQQAMNTMHLLRYHHQHQHHLQQIQQMHQAQVMNPFAPFPPQMFLYAPDQQIGGQPFSKAGRGMVNEKITHPRDSSVTSRSSSRADPVQIMEKLDDEVGASVDLDRTPRFGEVNKDKAERELPTRKAFIRRDSECSSISSSVVSSDLANGGLDESTLTKIYPNDEFRGGRGVVSPSPPAALLSEPLSRMDVLSEKIWDYHNKVAQTDEMLQRKLHLRDMLYTAISPVFPMSGLYVVGSSLNGFGNNSSDMDLCLMITNKDLDQKNDAVVVLNLILSTLQYEKFVDSQKLILAKVPILRIQFAAPFDDITVDLNANNSVAIRNTHLLCYYSSYDWRVRPLVSVVKEWAKRKGINDANKSSFTSYSLVLMVIHYLQCGTTPKVLPNLQQTYPTRFSNKVDVRTLNVTMPLEQTTEMIEETSLSEKTTLGELLIGFLDYYANRFDYDHDAISIRQGQRVERATLAARPKMHTAGEKETPPPSSSASSSSLHNGGIPSMMHHSMSNPHFWRSQWRCVCIEEPFTNSNTAHSIYDEMVFGAIKEAFREAHGELQNNHDLDRLMECEPIKASITNTGATVYAASYEGERPLAQQPNSIATANLRVMNVMVPGSTTAAGQFHFQQQPQILKQQRSNHQFQMNSQRNGNTSTNNQQHNGHRRSYQQGQSSGGQPRPSRSNESFNKETSSRQQQSTQKAKENVPERKQNKKEESNKTKRTPDGKSKQLEKAAQ